MKRIVLFVSLVLGVFAAPAAHAEEPKTPRVGFLLMGSSQAGLTSAFDAFREGLRELGWIEKENIVIEYRWAGESPDRLPELAGELVRLKVDVIIGSTPGVRAAQQVTTSIPVIMCIADDAVKQGFVSNLARPGGNITGMTAMTSELAGKRLEILRETTPSVSRVALLWNPPGSGPDYLTDTQTAAHSLGLTVQSVEVRTADDFESAFAAVIKGRAQALVVGPGQFMFTHQKQVVEFATRNNLPSIYAWKGPAIAGGLLAYGVNIPQVYRRAAAKSLGIAIPQSILLRADEVIR
jgi:putative tryptophan/tyrosine transport system substrate-binding protein